MIHPRLAKRSVGADIRYGQLGWVGCTFFYALATVFYFLGALGFIQLYYAPFQGSWR